jgi:peptidoglycan/xylan/chitin deacetylase (PgdA/CDA1 family)
VTRLLSLLYHDIYASHPAESGFSGAAAERYKISLSDFDQQLAGLERVLRHAPVRVGELRGAAAGEMPVALTVDDGGLSYFSVIADRLEARGWRGHCFVTTDRIGHTGFLHKHHLRELQARGHVIGSHSVSHPGRFAACTPQEMLREWDESRRVLEDILGGDVPTASVPGGYFSARVARAAAQAGLKALFTSEPETRIREISGCMVLGRFAIRHGDAVDYPARLVTRAPTALYGAWLGWNAKKGLKALLGPGYPGFAGWLAAPRRRTGP